VSQKTLGYYFR